MKTKKSFIWLAFLILATIWILVRRNQQNDYNSVLYSEQYITLPINIKVI